MKTKNKKPIYVWGIGNTLYEYEPFESQNIHSKWRSLGNKIHLEDAEFPTDKPQKFVLMPVVE